jgi:hypothetical protein
MPSVDAAHLNVLRRVLLSSLLAMLTHDMVSQSKVLFETSANLGSNKHQTILTYLVDDLSELLKNLLLVGELQGQSTSTGGIPRIRAFQQLDARFCATVGANVVEILLPYPANLMRCQTTTVTLVGQLLRIDSQGWVSRCLEQRASTRLWVVLSAYLASQTTTSAMKLSVLKLILNSLIHIPSSAQALQVLRMHFIEFSSYIYNNCIFYFFFP